MLCEKEVEGRGREQANSLRHKLKHLLDNFQHNHMRLEPASEKIHQRNIGHACEVEFRARGNSHHPEWFTRGLAALSCPDTSSPEAQKHLDRLRPIAITPYTMRIPSPCLPPTKTQPRGRHSGLRSSIAL